LHQFDPPPKNPNFVGRVAELQTIYHNLQANDGRKPIRVAIHGLGGVGKTTLAAEYAHRFRRELGGVVWCSCDTRATLLTILASLASTIHAVPQDDRNLEKAARTALRWLDAQASPWLLVYDNVTSPDVIREFLPQGQTRLLITSRFGDWRSWAATLPLGVLAEEQAVQFVQDRSGCDDAKEAAQLVEALGRLPLALDHAAAFCKQTSTSLSDYLQTLERRLAAVPAGVEYTASFQAVYELSMVAATNMAKEAPYLLRLLSFLAPDRIPRFVVDDSILENDARDRALIALGASSLINPGPDQTISMHPLVRLLARSKVRENGTEQDALRAITRRMEQLLPKLSLYEPEKWPRLRALIPHVLSLAENTEWTKDSGRDFVKAATAVGQLLWAYEARRDSEMLYRRAIRIGEDLLGPDDRDVNDALSDLAIICSNTDRLPEAEDLAKGAHATALRLYDGKHPTVGIRIQVLAFIYQKRGKLAEAEQVYRTSIESIDLPPNRHENYIWRANLAHCLWQGQRFNEAERFARDALERAALIAPNGNDNTGRATIYLSLILKDTGRLAEAKTHAKAAVKVLASTVGKTHPTVGWGLGTLAQILLKQGLPKEALQEAETALSILSIKRDEADPWIKQARETQTLAQEAVRRSVGA
jgi:tetratricopeptide (TPR) repeat protein